MEKMRYKVGDKVRVVSLGDPNYGSWATIGEVYTIELARYSPALNTSVYSLRCANWFYEDCLRPVFNKGIIGGELV